MEGWNTRHEVRSRNWEALREEKLQDLLAIFDKRMSRLNDNYLRMMGEHIADIGKLWPSDIHRLQQIRRMNRNLSTIQHRISLIAGQTEEDVERIFRQIATYDARMQAKILGQPDTVNVNENPYLRRILHGQIRETVGRMENLSNTTVVSKWYRGAIDEAVTAVQSGVEDYGTAIRRVIREAGQHGLRVAEGGQRLVDYESGYYRRLDSAARMNVLDGVRHLNQTIMESVARDFGADGVEIDAHMLCAEDHLPYQGEQYSNQEFEDIQDSLQRPFGEWNCRHSWHGIMLGISPRAYSDEDLQAMRNYSTEQITIDGTTRTRYQWSQEMRRIETAVRQQKDTATLARYTGDDKLRMRCQGTILQLNQKYAQLADRAGLQPEYQRTYVAGFRDVKGDSTLSIRMLSPNFDASSRRLDYAAASEFAQGDTRLINMLRVGTPVEVASAVNQILTDRYHLPDSVWKGVVHIKNFSDLNWAGGRKEPDCSISVCENLKYDAGLFIHENIHSRSGSKHLTEQIPYRKALEEGAVEYLTKAICDENHIDHKLQYTEYVGAFRNIQHIVAKNMSDIEFAKMLIDTPLNERYNIINEMIKTETVRRNGLSVRESEQLNRSLKVIRSEVR